MKLTISTSDKRFSAVLCESDCNNLFNNFVKKVLNIDPAQDTDGKAIENKPMEEHNTKEPIIFAKGHKGFLYIECGKCHTRKGFNAKTPIYEFYCDECGEITTLPEKLTDLKFKCECGAGWGYKTNVTENMFDINCLNCNSPVAVQYNEKLNLYQNVK